MKTFFDRNLVRVKFSNRLGTVTLFEKGDGSIFISCVILAVSIDLDNGIGSLQFFVRGDGRPFFSLSFGCVDVTYVPSPRTYRDKKAPYFGIIFWKYFFTFGVSRFYTNRKKRFVKEWGVLR